MFMSPFLDAPQNRAYSKRKWAVAGTQDKTNFYMLFWKSQTNCYRLWAVDLGVSDISFFARSRSPWVQGREVSAVDRMIINLKGQRSNQCGSANAKSSGWKGRT